MGNTNVKGVRRTSISGKSDQQNESKAGMSRSASGTEISERNITNFVPAEKLAKVCMISALYIVFHFIMYRS